MKRRTSRPSSSRKYSAIVSADRPTRRRAPGGSFIWPKTKAVLARTPDSVISLMRSLPSRERSPTPAKTETPACSWATFRISSWMMTVLPTPAPPKMPILPPFLNGQIRSMTLMPVSKTSTSVVCSSKAGAARWIGRTSVRSTGPFAVDRVAQHVEDPAQRRRADRDARSGRRCRGPPSRGPGRRSWSSPRRGPSCCPGAAGPRRRAGRGPAARSPPRCRSGAAGRRGTRCRRRVR